MQHPLLNKRICLIHMEDVDPIPPGTKGTVIGVNPVGLDMKWDNGRSLALIQRKTNSPSWTRNVRRRTNRLVLLPQHDDGPHKKRK